MNRPPMVITENSICVILNGKSHMVNETHVNYNEIREAIRASSWEKLSALVDVQHAVKKFSKGKYELSEDSVMFDGEKLPLALENKIIAFMKEGIDFDFMLKFHERLQANPSRRAVQELYDFLEHKNIPIGEDGCFYAYKAVKSDFKDIYSGTVDNSVGNVIEMPRNRVDDNRSIGCSHGYHVGSLKYVQGYGSDSSQYLICKIDPADVVSVPADSSCQKVRVCKYTVASIYEGPLPETVWNHEEPDRNYGYDDDDELDYCDWCQGDGEVEFECQACLGEGEVEAVFPAGEWQECTFCLGAGYGYEDCDHCGGVL